MCVAVVVETPEGPTLSELRDMEISNPHGGGIAWPGSTGIMWAKGLDADEVHEILRSVPRPCLVHFRWATHGPKVPHLAHPFPLGIGAITSKATTGCDPAVMIHNGTWRSYKKHTRRIPKGTKCVPLSDTAVAAWAAASDEDILDDVAWSTAVGRFGGPGVLDVVLRGAWEEYNGNMYSNLHWQWGYSSGWRSASEEYSTELSSGWDKQVAATEDTAPDRVLSPATVAWLREYEEAQKALEAEGKKARRDRRVK